MKIVAGFGLQINYRAGMELFQNQREKEKLYMPIGIVLSLFTAKSQKKDYMFAILAIIQVASIRTIYF